MLISDYLSHLCYFRERGSYDVADNLLAAAEKQWEVHLRTQKMMSRRQTQSSEPGGHRSESSDERVVIRNYASITEESDKEEENDNQDNDASSDLSNVQSVVDEDRREVVRSRPLSG